LMFYKKRSTINFNETAFEIPYKTLIPFY